MAKKDELKNEEIKDEELMEEEDLDLEEDEVDVEDLEDEDEEDDEEEEDDDDVEDDEEDEEDIEDDEEEEKEKKADKKSKKKEKVYTESEFNKKLEQIIAARTSQITKKLNQEKPKGKKSKEKASNDEVLEELRQLRQENKLNKFKDNAQAAGVDSNIIANILKVSDVDKLDDIDLDELASGSKKITNFKTTKPIKKRVQGTKKLEKAADEALDELFE